MVGHFSPQKNELDRLGGYATFTGSPDVGHLQETGED
jgi:hypothetical protein